MIATLALTARVTLAAVFAVAAWGKLVDRDGTRRAVEGFGVPRRFGLALAVLLPLVELATAALLLPATTAVGGAGAALALLLVFSMAIAANLALGRSPDCHCFGQLHSAPASWKTLARNGALAVLAAFAVGGSLGTDERSATAWLGRLESAELLALAVGAVAVGLLTVGGLAFLSLLRSYGRVLVRLERVEASLAQAGIALDEDTGLPPEHGFQPGTPAPDFPEREELLARGLPILLVFTSPTCGPCRALVPRVAEWQSEHADALTVVLASHGDAGSVRAEAEELELEHVLFDEDRRLYDAYHANGTPSAVLIAPDGTIGSWVAPGAEWIERLVAQALEAGGETGLPVGLEPPPLELQSLDGGRIALADLRGEETLLLFWNPRCGFCRSMHDDLLHWERSTNGDGPRLVVVSSGDEESTRAEGFASTVLLDLAFAAGGAFGAGGTPTAVLLDAQGRVASEVVVGAEAVLSLADARAATLGGSSLS